MADVQHNALRPGVASGIHVVHAWEVASEAARTGLAVTANQDEGKVCKQVVSGVVTWWILDKVTSGVGTWTRMGGVDPTLRLPVLSYTGTTFNPITGTVQKNYFEASGLTLTAADVGRMATGADGGLYLFTDYQLDMADEAP